MKSLYNKFLHSYKIQILLLMCIGFATMHQVLFFYFANDDFTMLYNLHILHAPHPYPYYSIVPFYSLVHYILQLNPVGYFTQGMLSFLISIVVFYFFCKELFPKSLTLPFLTALIYSTSPIGMNSNLFAITFSFNYVAIILLILVLLLYLRFLKTENSKYYISSLFLFGASLWIIPFRSFMYVFILVVAELLFSKKKLNSIKLIFARLLPFIILFSLYFFYIAPHFLIKVPQLGGSFSDLINTTLKLNTLHIPFVSLTNMFFAGVLMLTTPYGSLQESAFEVLCIITLGGIAFLILKTWKKYNYEVKVLLFSITWIYINILLFYIITVQGYAEVNARHMIFSNPAYAIFIICIFVLLIKYAKKVLILKKILPVMYVSIILINFLSVQFYYIKYNEERSRYAYAFFNKLKTVLPQIKKNMLIYVFTSDNPDKKYRIENIITVGYYDSEAAFSIFYNIRQEDFKVFKNIPDLKDYLKNNKSKNNNNIVGLYFSKENGYTLSDSTSDVLNLLKE